MASTSTRKVTKSDAEDKQNLLKAAVIIGALVVVIAFLIVSVKNSTSISSVTPTQTASSQDTANNVILTQLASKCQGNYNLLTPQEQQQADTIAHGRGAWAITAMYHK